MAAKRDSSGKFIKGSGVTDTDLGFLNIRKELMAFEAMTLLIGYPGSEDGGNADVAEIAAYQEFGTEDNDGNVLIPARPFLSSAMSENQDKIGKAIEQAIDSIIAGGTALAAYRRLGLFGVALVQQRIRDARTWAEPLSDATEAAKGSSLPLVDTAQMINSTTYVIKRGGTVVATG